MRRKGVLTLVLAALVLGTMSVEAGFNLGNLKLPANQSSWRGGRRFQTRSFSEEGLQSIYI